ncbi:MAG: hypothetical protein PHW52_03925 [Candidatus Pacebacteria bacterium]|nr:hypothetical protein [Candidatus Paceibacterota bacterium]
MIKETGCCPIFDPLPWDGKLLEWHNKNFIKGSVFTLFFMPINFGSVITKLYKGLEASGIKTTDMICLSDHTSKWNMDIYLSADKEVPGMENIQLSGKYLSKVYEGNFNKTEEWCNDFKAYAKNNGYQVKKWFMWYTTCPKCAKEYGKNYVVIIGEV